MKAASRISKREYGIGVAVPESDAVNFEAGYKLVTRNGKHRFNVAAFYFDWTNQAFTQAVFGFDTNGDGVVDENDELSVDYQTVAGQSEIKGVELFYSGWLGRFFNVSASYNYNDAKYVKFEDTTHGRVFGSRDASGKTMPRSPKSFRNPGSSGSSFPSAGPGNSTPAQTMSIEAPPTHGRSISPRPAPPTV